MSKTTSIPTPPTREAKRAAHLLDGGCTARRFSSPVRGDSGQHGAPVPTRRRYESTGHPRGRPAHGLVGPGSPDIVEIVKTVVKAVEKTVEKIEKTVETSVRTLVTDTRPSRAGRTSFPGATQDPGATRRPTGCGTGR